MAESNTRVPPATEGPAQPPRPIEGEPDNNIVSTNPVQGSQGITW